ncbi:MAG: HI0074 family nucleotidyltransferase substrate-binding subunit [Ignavibacteriales bacterium]|nr:HI0074 family nucleotidyltransferase substrate-binding subunit [Ignavibacteriales bacterium]
MKRLEQYKVDFKNALSALDAAADEAHTDLEIDGTIQRFEFTYELFWKLLKSYLQQEGVLVNTPKECFKEAFRVGIIDNQESVLKMVDDRNLTVHIYDLKTSREVFERIRLSHRVAFRKAMERMEK